jgi:diguanylate cyclase (GGDEF)-like protein
MDTQTIVVIAVAINVVIAFLAIGLPRVGAGRRSPNRLATAGASAGAGTASAGAAGAGAAGGGMTGAAATGATSNETSMNGSAGYAAPAFPSDLRRTAATDLRGWAPVDEHVDVLDPETGLDVAAAWARWLTEEDARTRRFHHPATIVLVELAGLDRLVDRVGQDAAERLIPPIAATMRRYGRETDHVARLGPTRFGALLTETDEVRAINYVERIRSACDVWLAAGAISLRLAIGWAEINPNRRAAIAATEAEQRLFAERQRPHPEEPAADRREAPVSLVAASPG